MATFTRPTVVAIVGGVLMATPALGQSQEVDPTKKFSWGENIGWMNWRDADGGDEGVIISFVDDPIIPDGDPFAWFNGYIWAENAGWISMGQGLGPFGGSFGTGVNILTTGYLEGLAWGENIGWVNFGTRPFIGNDGARYDSMAKRLRGWAWGENVGWINLEDALHGVHFVSSCGADLSGDGFVNGADLANLLASWGPGASAADLTGDGMVNGADLAALLANWGPCD